MQLSPEGYRCAEHNLDLTEEVRARLSGKIPVAYYLVQARSQARLESFKVIVSCPGKGEEHRLRFSGQVIY
jgi:hypothetical protein